MSIKIPSITDTIKLARCVTYIQRPDVTNDVIMT